MGDPAKFQVLGLVTPSLGRKAASLEGVNASFWGSGGGLEPQKPYDKSATESDGAEMSR